MSKLEQAARQALEALEVSTDWDIGAKGKQLESMRAITALREALENPDLCPHGVDDGACKQCYMEQTEQPASQEPEVWYCPDCGTLSETQVKCCPDWIRSRKVPKNFAFTCKATFDRNVQAEQEPVTISCECGDIYERDSFGGRFIKLHGICPNCDAVPQAEQKPVAVVEITYGKEPECYVTGNIDDFPEGVFKLYAAPVRTKDLTGQDLCDLEVAVGWKGDSYDFEVIAKAVIAKFKEKNK